MPFLNFQLQKTPLEFDKFEILKKGMSFHLWRFRWYRRNKAPLSRICEERKARHKCLNHKPCQRLVSRIVRLYHAHFTLHQRFTAPTSCVTWLIGQSWWTGLCKLKNHLTIRSYVFHHWSIGLLLSWTRLSDYKHDPYWNSLAKSSRTHGKINIRH